MRVLVTGYKDYIGAHLVDLLKRHGHIVTGVDLDLFGGCEWEPLVKPDAELIGDVRTMRSHDVDGHDRGAI